ncbi:lysoplasmalogenase family protein [Christensenella tenuis]|jgi:uncharacterized membrane protein YhhN|uniref:YhhN-like protein n=1 Tax=Christensenella tenuis TaxID=2763033 RepID=A0ABR7EK20_9FIRM|nr:lysoplasmalogenase family protein [Christensenella tenuis]MBC5649344.1 hypothetical protein [Christensenella tenuis]
MVAVELIFVAAVYFVLLGFYVREDLFGKFNRATKLKMTLSSIFCLVGAWGVLSWGASISVGAVLILCGLVCALAGDYFLRFIELDARKFNRGILFFAGTQALFLASMFVVQGIDPVELILTLVPLAVALILMKKQNWQLGKAQGPLTVYMILLSLMMVKAVVTALVPTDAAPDDWTLPVGPQSISYALMAAGAIFFWISDLLLGIWKYHSRKNAITAWNSITYFTGTFLIALSLQPMFA